MRCHAFLLALIALAAGLFSGCDSDPLGRKAIQGKVTLDGQPLNTGSVEFHPTSAGGGAVQSGAIIAAGSYSIPRAQGLPPGTYRVMVFATEEAPPLPPDHMPGDDVPEPKSLIPSQWNTDSQHTIEVTESGDNEFNFEITTKGT